MAPYARALSAADGGSAATVKEEEREEDETRRVVLVTPLLVEEEEEEGNGRPGGAHVVARIISFCTADILQVSPPTTTIFPCLNSPPRLSREQRVTITREDNVDPGVIIIIVVVVVVVICRGCGTQYVVIIPRTVL